MCEAIFVNLLARCGYQALLPLLVERSASPSGKSDFRFSDSKTLTRNEGLGLLIISRCSSDSPSIDVEYCLEIQR